jgi:tetratricopeptide (TPR) repeat protein
MSPVANLSLGVALVLIVAGCRGPQRTSESQSSAILTARTLGLAYLESGQLAQAESAFRKVVALAPDQPLGHANLGLVHLRQGRYRDAEAEIRRAARLDSTSDDIGLMLATVYQLTDRPDDARRVAEQLLQHTPDEPRALYLLAELDPGSKEQHLRRIVERTPANVAARLQLVDVLLARGAANAATAELEALQRQLPELPRETNRSFDRALAATRAGNAAAAVRPAAAFHRLMETTPVYQASLRRLQGASGAQPGFPVLTFNPVIAAQSPDARAVAAAVRFDDVTAATGLAVPAQGAALAVGDYDGDGSDDVFAAGHLFRNELGRVSETDRGRFGDAQAAAFGDYDNDGRLDLFVSTASGGTLFHNTGDSTFRDVAKTAAASAALFVDLDHDGDLDLFLAAPPPTGNQAYRNNPDGPFQPFPMPQMDGRDVAFGDLDGDGHVDLIVVGATGRLTVLHNAGQGRFETAQAGTPEEAAVVAVGDYDNDGYLDLFLGDGLYRNRGDGTFEPDRRSPALGAVRATARAATFFDYDNDGSLDLVVAGPRVFLFRNDQRGRFVDRSAILPADAGSARHVTALDYDRDGDLDLLFMGEDGRPRLLLNEGGNANQYVQVQLTALRTGSGKNNTFGIGSTLELRAGELYETRVVTGRVTHFGLGQRIKADVLRVRWPNGVAQTVYYPVSDEDILEQQVLKGSCPFLYAWDGRAFTFVTDVMWRSALGMPLGIMAGESQIAAAPPHASREYMRIPGRALAPHKGRYVLQVTEELWEVAYLDQVRLLVVDHPDSVDVYVDEGFVPPTPGPAALRLYPVVRPRPAIAATDEHGADWTAALRARDDRYVAPLTPTRYQGIATLHDLVLDFGDVSRTDSVRLFLAGWIFPTDASINLALAYGKGAGVTFPYLEVKDPAGRWQRVAEVSFPSGKSKTVIVDLTGKFLSADHRVRIRTNMEIYWDQAFLASGGSPQTTTVTTLDPIGADLHYRGFSRMSRKGGRYGYQWPDYADVSRETPWEPIVGAYTRYGDVLPLVGAADDMYAIIAPGDEVTLTFDAAAAPPLRPGWTRDFVLYTDAWLKDSDRNTAAGNTVGPLPFHGMSRYPYGPDEAYPTDRTHVRYRDAYNTRRVGRGPRP